MNIKYIASIGANLKVTPWDDICIEAEKSREYIADCTPFEFMVKGRLEDGQIFYGLFGPIVSGPDRYQGLICNVMVREDGTDWRNEKISSANFCVGPTVATRCHAYDFRHPGGTEVSGYPKFSRYGEIRVIDEVE